MLEDPISRALVDDKIGTDSAAIVAPEAGAVPVALFSSGWGDGSYPTWLGLSGRGDIVAAVTDFLLTADPCEAQGTRPGPPQPGEEAVQQAPVAACRTRGAIQAQGGPWPHSRNVSE